MRGKKHIASPIFRCYDVLLRYDLSGENEIMKSKKLFCSIIVGLSLFLVSPVYSFDSEILPGEGSLVVYAKADSLTLYQSPSQKSKIVEKIKVKKDEVIDYEKGLYINVKPGKVKVLKPVKIEGRDLDITDHLTPVTYYSEHIDYARLSLKKGDIIEYISPRAEGNCLIRNQKRIIEIQCLWTVTGNKDFALISEPVNETWINVIANKKAVGWLLINDKSVRTERKF